MTRFCRLALMLAILIPALMVGTGCSRATNVTFDTHSAYRAPDRINAPLLIVIPDELNTERTRVNIPSILWFNDKFDIYYGQALSAEADARFRNMFTDLFVVPESIYNELRKEEGLDPIVISETPVAEDDSSRSRRQNEQRLIEEERRREVLDFVPWFAREPRGYVLLLQRPRYVFVEGRSILAVQATLLDRMTDEPIMEGAMRGQSPRVTPRQSKSLREIELHKSVVAASSILYTNMRERMRQSIEDDIAGN